MPELQTPTKTRDYARLREAVEFSRRRLRPAREHRLLALRQFVGSHYSDNGAEARVPINFLELAVGIYRRQLAAQAPAVLAIATNKKLKSQALELEIAHNHLLKEINFASSVQEWVTDAMFPGPGGILKVGISIGEDQGFLHNPGQPFADPVGSDDWVHDMTVKRWEQIQFCGDRYEMPRDAVASLSERDLGDVLLKGEGGVPRVRSLGLGEQGAVTRFRDVVELWDFWLPRERRIVTMLADADGMPSVDRPPIQIIDWEGPEVGPYHRLVFNKVPENTMPLAPVSLWMDLHDLANRMFRKLGRQVDRQKTVTAVRGGADADGNRVLDADDGTMVRLDDPNAVKELTYGGIHPPSLAFLLQVKELFSYMAGNLETLGGLSPQAGTLGQEQLLSASASQRMRDMEDFTHNATKGVVESLADYLWYDPMIEIPLVKPIRGTSIEIPFVFSPETREGDRLDYEIDIVPFSMGNRSPGEKLQGIAMVLERFIIPLMPQLAEQGIVPDWKVLLDIFARYGNTPELRDILTMSDLPLPRSGGADRPLQAPTTTRNTVRRSVPSPSQSSGDQMISRLMEAGKQ